MGFTPNNFRCDFLQILTDGLILKNKSCMDVVLFMQISFPLFIFRVSFPLPFPWSRPAAHLLFSRQSVTAYRWRMICLHIRETEKFAFTHHKWVVWYTLSGLTRSAKLATVWFAVALPKAFLVVSFVQVSCPRKARNGQRTSYFWGEFFQKCRWTENFRKILENKWEETKVRNNNFVY